MAAKRPNRSIKMISFELAYAAFYDNHNSLCGVIDYLNSTFNLIVDVF